MLDSIIKTVSHAYLLGKKCATHATKYSPHSLPQFVWGCDDYVNHLPQQETRCMEYGSELMLHFADIWRKVFELGVEEIRRERILVEEPPIPTIKVKRYGKKKTSKTIVDLSEVEWV